MQISVTFKGDLVRKGLQNLAAEMPQIGRQPIRTAMERIKRRMQEYPPEPSGQSTASSHSVLGTVYRRTRGRYQRTGNFGGHWVITEADHGYKLANTATRKGRAYGHYVVGDAYGRGQAWMHEGRWQLLRDVVDEETQKLPAEVERLVNLVARREGLK